VSHETRQLRAAVIGLGKLGLLHAATFNVLPDCRLVAVADKTKPILDGLKARMEGVSAYSDHLRLLDEVRPDLVAIATPTGLHVPIAVDCVERGIPVFIEKPLSLNSGQADPLLRSLRQRPVVNMVGYMTRFVDTFRKAKELLDSGVLGRPQMLKGSMYIGQLFKRGKGWRYDKAASGGGVLTTQNSHVIDLLLWYFGDIRWVSAHVTRLYSEQVEDHAHVFMQFANGLRGFFDASWSARHYRTPTVVIHVQGENGTLDVDDDGVRLFVADPASGMSAGWHNWRKPDLYRGTVFDIGGPNYTEQALQFLGALRGEGHIESDVASAYKVQQVIDAAYASAEQNGAPKKIEVASNGRFGAL
jgi:predicted dehydrogenase